MSDENNSVIILLGLAVIGVIVTVVSVFVTYWALTSPMARIWSAQSNPIIIFGITFIFFSFVAFGLLAGLSGESTTHRQPQPQPTVTQSTSEPDTTSYEPEPEPEPISEPANPFSDVLKEDGQETTGYDTGSISIDENPGRTRGDYEEINPNIGSDEPRYSDHHRNQDYSGKTAYSEEDDEDLSNLDIDLDDI